MPELLTPVNPSGTWRASVYDLTPGIFFSSVSLCVTATGTKFGARGFPASARLGIEKLADHFFDVLMLTVDLVIQAAHRLFIKRARQAGEDFSQFRMFFQHLLPDQWDSVVGREVMFVVLEGKKFQ